MSSAQIQSGNGGGHNRSLHGSIEGDSEDYDGTNAGLVNISVDNPFQKTPNTKELDQKRLSKLRAKQLQMSLAEREARRNQLAMGGQALME